MTVTSILRPFALVNALLISALLFAGSATAQGSVQDSRWLPWLGCWQPTEAQAPDAPAAAPAPVVCIIPVSGQSAVELVTVVNGTVSSRERIQASAQQRREDQGCSGAEQVQWSQDGRRLYRVIEHACPGGIQRRASGLMAILPGGDWLSTQGISVAGNTDVRVVRYRPVASTHAVPAEITRSLAGRDLVVDAARIGAAATPSTRDIAEAAKRLDADVVSAWLIEREEGFALDAQRLIELADAGIPEPVIDVMVALSYPRVFAINRNTGKTRLRPEDRTRGTDGRRPGPVATMDPWGRYPGYGYGYGYDYGWGYYPGYGTGYYGRPVIIVRGPENDEGRGQARAVNGQGYTRRSTDSSGGTGSTPRPSSGSSQSSGSSSSSSGSSSGSSGSSSSDTGRTAKPRPDSN